MDFLSAYKTEFLKQDFGEKSGVASAREEGLKTFIEKGLPTPKTEDWRYSDLGLIRTSYLKKTAALGQKKVASITGWPTLVIENGQVSDIQETLKGVEILSASKDPKKYQDKGLFDSPLERLNLALSEGGLCFKFTKAFDLPGLEVVFLNTAPQDEALYLRNLMTLEKGVKANLFIRTISLTPKTWTNQVTNFFLGENSGLTLFRDFETAENSLLTLRDFGAVEKNATFKAAAILAGLPSVRYEIEAALLGKGAHADFSGGMLAGADNTIDVLTRVHHVHGHTTSNQIFKGIAGAKGVTAFQGRVRVEKDAQKIEAHQNCNNLILERGGEANVKPELLIFADDVICSHGATVGEVDENALFYMMQRGFTENQARGILVQAFLGEVLEGIGDETISGYFKDKVETWMAGVLA